MGSRKLTGISTSPLYGDIEGQSTYLTDYLTAGLSNRLGVWDSLKGMYQTDMFQRLDRLYNFSNSDAFVWGPTRSYVSNSEYDVLYYWVFLPVTFGYPIGSNLPEEDFHTIEYGVPPQDVVIKMISKVTWGYEPHTNRCTKINLGQGFINNNIQFVSGEILRGNLVKADYLISDSWNKPYWPSEQLAKTNGSYIYLRIKVKAQRNDDAGTDIWEEFTYETPWENRYDVASALAMTYRNGVESPGTIPLDFYHWQTLHFLQYGSEAYFTGIYWAHWEYEGREFIHAYSPLLQKNPFLDRAGYLGTLIHNPDPRFRVAPHIPLKEGNRWFGNRPEELKSGNLACRIMDLDYEGFKTSLKETDDAASSKEGKIWSAHIHAGVDVASKSQGAMAYIAEFIKFLDREFIGDEGIYLANRTWERNERVPPPQLTRMQLIGGQFTYDFYFTFTAVKLNRRGVKGKIGDYRKTIRVVNLDGQSPSNVYDASLIPLNRTCSEYTRVTVFHQRTATHYDEYVLGPVAVEVESRWESTQLLTLWDTAENDEGRTIFLPMFLDVYRRVGGIHRGLLSKEVMRLTNTSYLIQKVPRWLSFLEKYGPILKVAMTIMSIFTLGISGVLLITIGGELLTRGLTWVLEKFDWLPPEVLVVIYSIVGISAGIAGFAGIMEEVLADIIMKAAEIVVSAASAVALSNYSAEVSRLAEQQSEHETTLKENWERLNEAYEKLGVRDINIELGMLRAERTISSESPEMFYNRTIHTTNPGPKVYDVLNNYYAIKATLPEGELPDDEQDETFSLGF